MADDPRNELLARGPRFRLSAEMIRDNALAAAGLLSEAHRRRAGESVRDERGLQARGAERRRRRLSPQPLHELAPHRPPPAMVAFDAPRRAVCSAKRERTDSPLQALILLNGTQYVEAARVLGEKLHREAKGDVAAMIEQGFLRCLSRQPDAREREITTQLYREQLAYFQSKPGGSRRAAQDRQREAAGDIPAPEAAAAASARAGVDEPRRLRGETLNRS